MRKVRRDLSRALARPASHNSGEVRRYELRHPTPDTRHPGASFPPPPKGHATCGKCKPEHRCGADQPCPDVAEFALTIATRVTLQAWNTAECAPLNRRYFLRHVRASRSEA